MNKTSHYAGGCFGTTFYFDEVNGNRVKSVGSDIKTGLYLAIPLIGASLIPILLALW